MTDHVNIGRLQVVWWPRRCLFKVWEWPSIPESPEVLPMFRAVIMWPLEFRWWLKPSRARFDSFRQANRRAANE